MAWLLPYFANAIITLRRALRGPLLPGWSWNLEASVHFLRSLGEKAFDLSLTDPNAGREYQDALAFNSPYLERVQIEAVDQPKGSWFIPDNDQKDATLLYFHGGGFQFYAKTPTCNWMSGNK